MRRLIPPLILALTLLGVIPLPHLTPTVVATAQSANIVLYKPYELSAVQGHYYAINTGGVPHTAYYYSTPNEKVYIPTYWWDANTSYIIFQSPVTSTIYLTANTSYTPTVLNTTAWFAPKPVIMNVTVSTRAVTGQTTFMSGTRKEYYRNGQTTSVSHVFTGSSVVVTNTSWFDISRSSFVSMQTTAFASSGATYTVYLELRVNTTASWLSINCTRMDVDVWYYTGAGLTPAANYLAISSTTMRGVNKVLGNAVTTNSDTLINSGSSVAVTGSTTSIDGTYSYNDIVPYYSLRVRGYATSAKVYQSVNNVITASNGNVIHIHNAPPPEITATLTTTLRHYMIAWVNLTTTHPIQKLNASTPGGWVAWVNGTGLTSGGHLTHIYTENGRINTTHTYIKIAYTPQAGLPPTTPINITATLTNGDKYTATTNITTQTTTLNTAWHIKLTPPATLQAGDLIAPHLYDLSFNGVNQHAVIGLQPDGSGKPFTVYGWSEITIEELVYPVWPKANALWSKTGMIGTHGGSDNVGTTLITDPATDYAFFGFRFSCRDSSGNLVQYNYNIPVYRNVWLHLVRRFTASRELSYWVNGSRAYTATVPSTVYTILEWNPDTASQPQVYKRFVLGTSAGFSEPMTVRYGYVRIYDRALTGDEISQSYGQKVVYASGLRLFIDPTFFDGTKYVDLSGNGNHAYPYNGPLRVPAQTPYMYILRGAVSGGEVRLRYFPNNSVVVFSDGSMVVVTGSVNSVGLVDTYSLSRTDISFVLTPVPDFSTSPITISSVSATPVFRGVSGVVSATITSSTPINSIALIIENVTNNNRVLGAWTYSQRQFIPQHSVQGNCTGVSTHVVWVNATSARVLSFYQVMEEFLGQSGSTRLKVTVCVEAGCKSFTITPSYVSGYSLTVNVDNRVTVGTEPPYTYTTNSTTTPSLHNLDGYLKLAPPTTLQAGDIIAPHLYDLYFDGVDDRVVVPHTTSLMPTTALTIMSRIQPNTLPTAYPRIISKETGNTTNSYALLINRNANTFELRFGSSVAVSGGQASINAWQHVAVGWRQSPPTGVLYINGSLAASGTTYSSTIPSTTYSLYIGNNPSNNMQFNGLISSIQIYSALLTGTDVNNAVSGLLTYSNLVLFLDATFWNGSKYVDLSGWGNHGTQYGGVQRVPASYPWLYVLRGSPQVSGLILLKFFPLGSIVVFSDGSAVSVVGEVNPAGLVESFAVSRTDISYILIPDPSNPGGINVKSRGDVGTLKFVGYMPVMGTYPYIETEVIYDKLVYTSLTASRGNGTRVDAFTGSVAVCVTLQHAWDGQPVVSGDVVLAGASASFNGTCWVRVITAPRTITSQNYIVITQAVDGVHGVAFVDPSPTLTYIWDALTVSLTSINYIDEVVSLTMRYAWDGSPVPSGTLALKHSGGTTAATVSNGATVIDLKTLPTNVTTTHSYGVSDGGAVVTPYANASVSFSRVVGGWWRVKSPAPTANIQCTVSGDVKVLKITGEGIVLWLSSAPELIYVPGGSYTVISGQYVINGTHVIAVMNADRVAGAMTIGAVPRAGAFTTGFTGNKTSPMSGFRMYVTQNMTSTYIGITGGGEKPVATNIATPLFVAVTYSYDPLTNTTQFCALLTYITDSTKYKGECISAEVTPPTDLYFFAYTNDTIVIDRFAATYGLGILKLSTGDINYWTQGPYTSTSMVKYVVLDKPTIIKLDYGGVTAMPGGAAGITFSGFSGYRLSMGVGGLSVTGVLIPTDNWLVDVPLGFTAFVVVDTTSRTVTLISVSPMRTPTHLLPGNVPLNPLPPGEVAPIQFPKPTLTPVYAVVVIATLTSVGVSAYVLSSRISVGLAVAGAASSLVGLVMTAIIDTTAGISLVAAGLLALTVAGILSITKIEW